MLSAGFFWSREGRLIEAMRTARSEPTKQPFGVGRKGAQRLGYPPNPAFEMPSLGSTGYYSGLEAPTITQLVRVFHYPKRHLASISSHLHHFFQLDIVFRGEIDVTLEHEPPFRAKRGAALLIPPLMRHAYQSDGGVNNCSFKFHLSFRYWAVFGKQFIQRQLDEALLNLVESTITAIVPETPFSRDRAVSLITLCLLEMAPKAEHAESIGEGLDSFRRRLWPLLDKVAKDPYGEWTISGLASACHINVDYFTKCFHELLGTTPQHYLLEARMRMAAEDLLFKQEMPIKEIAEQARYASVHSFTRAFTHVFGVGPATYRRSVEKI